MSARWIWFLGVVVVAFAAVPVAFVLLLRATVHPRSVDCATVQLPPPGQWAGLDASGKHDVAGDLELCRRFDGLAVTRLTDSLGPPDRSGVQGDGSTLWVYLLPTTDHPEELGHASSPDELRLTLASGDLLVESATTEYANTP